MSQNSENKSNCPKIGIPHDVISDVTDVPVSTVKAIRTGKRSNETATGQRVQVAEILINDGLNKLLAEVKRIVQF